MLVLAIILFLLFCGLLAGFIAGQRGYDPMAWYFGGLLLGPLGLICVLLPRHKHEPEALFRN